MKNATTGIRICSYSILALLAPCIISARQPATSTSADPEARFMTLAEEFIHQSLAIAPSSASSAGYHEHREPDGRVVQLDAILDDFSLAAYESQARFYRDWRARLATVPKGSLGPQAAADWQLIDDQVALQLLEYEQIRNTRHNPTVVVETIGTALFLPLTQEYAPMEVRIGHVLSRLEQVPRALIQARELLQDADPIFIKVAVEENEGNIALIDSTIRKTIPDGSPLDARYQSAAGPARTAIQQFNEWLRADFAGRKTDRTWRLGRAWYEAKFRYALGASLTPEQVLADAETELAKSRAEMMQLATPLHAQWFPAHGTHSDLSGTDRENAVLREVLDRISDDHPNRDQLLETISKDLERIKSFIRDKQIVSLGRRNNLHVIPTPPFMRGLYSVAGFHGAPPLEPTAEAQYWVTPIDPAMPEAAAESKLREYNQWVLLWLTIHEALPGHYVQAEHANDVQPPVRRLVRALFGNGPYTEGWAEYVADVMVNKGFADGDPRFQISRKKIWLRAVANTILDVKLHTMNLSDREALALMEERCFQTQAEAEGKLQRAKLSSVQLPTYFLGAREWWRLRQRYEQRAGASFDMKRFHDQALDAGALPVPALESLIK